MKTIQGIALGITALMLCAEVAEADNLSPGPLFGSVCVAEVPTPTEGDKSLANPTGGMANINYSVKVDDRPMVYASTSSVHWVNGLEYSKSHRLTLYADGKKKESFKFRFDKLEFKDKGSTDICFFLKPLYMTWQLWPVERTGDWCKCRRSN